MSNAFAVGDLVEFTENYMEHKVGDRFTVTAVEPSFDASQGTQLVQGRKPNNHSGVYSGRLKLVKPVYKVGDKVEVLEKSMWHEVGPGEITEVDGDDSLRVKQPQHTNRVGFWILPKDIRPLAEEVASVPAPEHEYKVGDRVQVTIPEGDTSSYGGMYFVTGIGTVKEVDGGTVIQVDADTKHPERHTSEGWWVDKKFVTPLQELKFEVGARVRSKGNHYGDSEGIVTRLEGPFGGDIEIAWDADSRYLSNMTLGASREYLEVIAPAPKTEKKKATLVDNDNKPQIGDTIVAFWENNGVEYRQKGVVARIGSDGTLATAERNHINVASGAHSYSYSGFAPHVYIVERAPKPAPAPEPVKVDPFEEAKAPFLEAAVGSKATIANEDLQYIKTGHDEWSLVTPVRIGYPRNTAVLLGDAHHAKSLTLHVL